MANRMHAGPSLAAAAYCEQLRATGWQVMLRVDPLRRKVPAGAPAGEDSSPLTYLDGAQGTLIGYHSPRYFHLLPGAAYNTIAKFSRDKGHRFGTKAHMVWKAMVEEGVLDAEDAQYIATRVYIEGEYRQLLRCNRSAVEKLWALSPRKSV